ncbi:hypothetical protein Tco_0929452 [Tanacetum coccineum]
MGDADEHEYEKAMRLIIRREKPATLSNVNLEQGIVTSLLEKPTTVRRVLKHEFLNLAVVCAWVICCRVSLKQKALIPIRLEMGMMGGKCSVLKMV